MKVKVEFYTFDPQTLKTSQVSYVVSSLWELLDRAMRLRRSRHLQSVSVWNTRGSCQYAVARKYRQGYQLGLHGSTRYVVPFFSEDVKDNDRFDEFLNRVWARILETEKEVYPDRIDRTGAPVPAALRKSKRN